jgi:hypothetical protein
MPWRGRGQALVMYVVALPVLLGFLALALDGGQYFAVRRAAQFAADSAARAAAVDVQRAQQPRLLNLVYYLRATSDGEAVGETNLVGIPLTGVNIEIAYNNTPKILSGALGWYTGIPTPLTRSVRARVSGTYNTLLLHLVGIVGVNLEQVGTQPVAVISLPPGVLPLGICTATRAAQPLGPWLLFQNGGDLCGVPNWEGLVDLDGTAINCSRYKNWVVPQPPSGPPPAAGSAVRLEQGLGCLDLDDVDDWLLPYIAQVESVVVVDAGAGGTVQGCQDVLILLVGGGLVQGTPIGQMSPCGELEQIE